MIKNMNFGNFKATFSRRSNRRHRPEANGVVENKDETPIDADDLQRSILCNKSTKHKPKTDKNGLWKTLRLKLGGGNRQCWDGNESPSPSDDSDPGGGISCASKQKKQNSTRSGSSVYPMPSPIHSPRDDQINPVINGLDDDQAGIQSVANPNCSQPIGFQWTSDEETVQHHLQDSNNMACEMTHYHTVPEIRSLTRELFKLSKYGWYWGPITRTEAEDKLSDQPDGAFLVRDSSDDRHLLSLSFRSYGKTLHTRIEHCNGLFSFYAQPEPEGHTSIVDLIEHSMNYSQSGVFCYSRARSPGSLSFPVRLTKPVSRFTQVRSLQYLCRFVIRQYTRFDHIQKLPLPSRIRGYIEEGHY